MRYHSSDIPEQYRHPDRNVYLVPCWASDIDGEVIEVPDDWQYPLPDPMPEPLHDAPEPDPLQYNVI
jgi:hypothetical protein